MRVRMAVDTEDSSRTTSFKGTVSAAAAVQDAGPWPRSPWRMLQVKWDDPDVLKNARSVSPWQVELVSDSTDLLTPYPVTKKPRVTESPEFLSDRDGNMLCQMTGFNAIKMESFTPPLFSYNTSPAGMQGARQDTYVSSLSQFEPTNSHRRLSDNLYGFNLPRDFKNVSTELSIGGVSQSHGSSPPSQESTNDNGTELLSAAASTPTGKADVVCFQLFGQVIHIKRPVDADFDKEYNESKDGVVSLDYSLSYPHKPLLNNLDVQC